MSKSEVEFNENDFIETFPEFEAVKTETLKSLFGYAVLFLDNTYFSVVKNMTERKKLLALVVAHLLELQIRGGGSVGAVASATQGKVSTSFALPTDQNYYSQTQYGYLFWQLTLKYRMGGRYYAYRGRH